MANRPSPEQLLLKYPQGTDSRGKLTIFLGAAAGVGKTFTMLKQIPELRKKGIDVVIGYIECHQRSDTLGVLPDDVEIIPLKEIEYKGIIRKELDVDGILKRKPALVIIDELAHSNVHGSRNTKRFQDVLEILSAGISVYTALNIQHIESLNDVVGQIVGTTIKETVPDYVLEQANEIKLIDITPDELINRLKEGKIYPVERINTALGNFFRKGNLTALREMALINTARKVEKQVKEYRTQNAIEEIWSSHDNLMVVLEVGYSTEKIIRSGKVMSNKGFSNWFVVYMDNSEFADKNIKEREKLLKLLGLAEELGAKILPLNGDRLDEAIVAFARDNNVNTVLLSQSRINLYYRLFNTSLVDKVRELAPEINLHLVTDDENNKNELGLSANKLKPKSKPINYPKLIKKTFTNLIIFTALSLILIPVSKFTSNINILMAYLLVIVLTSRGRGILSSIITALIATLSFDFFFIPPQFSFSISDLQYVFTFIVMATVGVLFGVMNGNLRFQLNISRKIQKQTRILYAFSRKLSEAMVESQVVEATTEFIPQLLTGRYALLVHTLNEELSIMHNQGLDDMDMVIAQWVFDNLKSAGYGTNTFSSSNICYIPIHSKIRSRGVLAILPDENDIKLFLPDTQELIENITQLLASTLERIHFTQIAIKTEVMLAKSEL